MRPFKDLTGELFGNLKVIAYATDFIWSLVVKSRSRSFIGKVSFFSGNLGAYRETNRRPKVEQK